MPAISGSLIALAALMAAAGIALTVTTRRRVRALSPQRGQIWRPANRALLLLFLPLLLGHQRLDAWLTQGAPPPLPVLIFCLPFWVLAALMILQPKGPVAWTPEGLTGPAPGLSGYRHRTAIGWTKVARITRDGAGNPSDPGIWWIWTADGRYLYFEPSQPGHETLIAALRHYRPDLDTAILSP